jgi:hypothetical protein
VRRSPSQKDGQYARQGPDDDRFANYVGAVQSIVTSSGQNDSGLFEANLRNEQYLPFEEAGAEITWKLDLPKDYPFFDYNTIADVILHIGYTARHGAESGRVKAALDELFQEVERSDLAILFSLRHDFPTIGSAFVSGGTDATFSATIRRDFSPYFTQGKTISKIQPVFFRSANRLTVAFSPNPVPELTTSAPEFTITATAAQGLPRDADAEVFLVLQHTLS